MSSYKVLNRQIFTIGEYSIVPIRFEDRLDIMRWRNEQIYHLRQQLPLTIEDQNNYFNNVINNLYEQSLPSQILFSYLRNDECIGYGGLVHINWSDRNAEISFIMDTEIEKNEFDLHWGNYLELLEQVAFDELNLHKIYTFAFDVRPKLYPLFENKGFTLGARLIDHCFFEGKFRDVVIHHKISNA